MKVFLKLLIGWSVRLKLRAEGAKLYAEGAKLYAEGAKLYAKNAKLRAEGAKLRAEGAKLYAEGAKLCAEGDKLRAEGDIGWATLIIKVHGNIKIEWKTNGDCYLETGEKFSASASPDSIETAIARAQENKVCE